MGGKRPTAASLSMTLENPADIKADITRTARLHDWAGLFCGKTKPDEKPQGRDERPRCWPDIPLNCRRLRAATVMRAFRPTHPATDLPIEIHDTHFILRDGRPAVVR